MLRFISYSYLCFSSLICAAEKTAEMSEIKDKEECYLIGCHQERHHGAQSLQELSDDSEPRSEKLLFSLRPQNKFIYIMSLNFLISCEAREDTIFVLIL